VQADAFAEAPFTGNPAAVCVLDAAAPDAWMQAVAAEMNLSETAFLHAESPGPDRTWRLRWFTPSAEVDLCGHATLAASHVLWTEGHLAPDREATFETRSGRLAAVWADGRIQMDFPAEPAREEVDAAGLADAFGLEATSVARAARNRFDLLVELRTEADVERARPDLARLASLDARGVAITAPCGSDGRSRGVGADFVSRFFAPAVGVPEDPVTGSAHCCLGPYWAERLGRPDVTGFQASARGGVVTVRVRGDRVTLGGVAVTVLRGGILGPSVNGEDRA
jgi:PhzF family phenazine biosynthesis protein